MKKLLPSLLAALSLAALLVAPAAQAAQPFTITGPNGAQANVSGGGLNVNATASIAAFNPTGQASLSASGTTSNVALGSVGPTAIVTNTGSVTAYINFGASSVTATTSSYPLLAGQSIAYNVGSGTYMAGITATSTAALLVTTGTGLPAIANPLFITRPTVTWTQTVVTLTAATSTTLLASNANRKALRWMVTGTNPVTIVPGSGPAVAGQGLNYNPGQGTGYQGGADAFGPNEISTQAFTAISTGGTTVVVWEGQ